MNILILHNVEDLRRARRSILDYLFAFQRYQPAHNYHYHRISDPPSPDIRGASWDAVILDSTALGISTFRPRELFLETMRRWSFLSNDRIVKAVFPQDDANHSGVMDDWFHEWGVQLVFSVRPEHKKLLYPRASQTAEFHHCYAGYIDDLGLPMLQGLSRPWHERKRLLGQRVTMYPYRGGRQGRLKGLIANKVKAAAAKRKIAVDISVDPADTLYGDAWYAFLGDCKYALASEGGLSLFDPYGEIQDRISVYLAKRPKASFEEVEAACFPGLDGVHTFEGFSPRIFEAAVCGACQVLVEGRYRDLLEPGRHYVPLKEDCSNLDDVFRSLKDEDAARNRVDACNEALVQNPAFRYATLASRVLDCIENLRPAKQPVKQRRQDDALRPAQARRGYAREIIAREAAIGFQGSALAERVGSTVAAQSAESVFLAGSRASLASDLMGRAAAVRAAAEQAALLAKSSDGKGLVSEGFAALAGGFEQLALLAECVSELGLALAIAHPNGAETELAAASATLVGAQTATEDMADRLAVASPDTSGLLQILGADRSSAHAVATMVAPIIETAGGRRSEPELAGLAKVADAFLKGGRAAKAMEVLAHDIPDDVLKLLDHVAPVSAQSGAWYPDDLERVRQARSSLDALASGGDRARLMLAIAGLNEGPALGIVSRLAPSSGAAFSKAELERLVQLDRIITRAGSGPGALGYLERVQAGGAELERLFSVFASGGDRARLMLAFAGLNEGPALGIVSRLAPSSGAAFSKAELERLVQLDRIITRAGSGPGALGYLERVQAGGAELERLFSVFASGGDRARLMLAFAGLNEGPALGIVSRLAPSSGAAFGKAELERLVQLDRIIIRASGDENVLDLLEKTQLLGERARLLIETESSGSELARLVFALASAGPEVVGFASRMRPNEGRAFSTPELARIVQLDRLVVRSLSGKVSLDRLEALQQSNPEALALVDLANQGGAPARFLRTLMADPRAEGLTLSGSLAGDASPVEGWPEAQLASFDVLAGVVEALKSDEQSGRAIEILSQSDSSDLAEIVNMLSFPEQSGDLQELRKEQRQLVARLAKTVTQSPARRRILRLMSGLLAVDGSN
jgi:hypothetical protein